MLAIRRRMESQVMVDFLVHFYRSGSEPFRSLSGLPDEDAGRRMKELYVAGSVFWERFKDPARYLSARREVERKLRTGFIAKGGKPRETHPVYMILGRPKWLDTAADPATLATTAEIRVPLSLFTEADVSFTYPDSMTTFPLAERKDSAFSMPDLFGKVFTLPEIRAIVDAGGLPGEKWAADLPPDLPNYIEAQVWNRTPLASVPRPRSAPSGAE
ncbi:MAG: hypothetical protein JW929_15595 [Anaerolineales bacterium]|nr:hypothetical protein [Anaerolineales bacterium]